MKERQIVPSRASYPVQHSPRALNLPESFLYVWHKDDVIEVLELSSYWYMRFGGAVSTLFTRIFILAAFCCCACCSCFTGILTVLCNVLIAFLFTHWSQHVQHVTLIIGTTQVSSQQSVALRYQQGDSTLRNTLCSTLLYVPVYVGRLVSHQPQSVGSCKAVQQQSPYVNHEQSVQRYWRLVQPQASLEPRGYAIASAVLQLNYRMREVWMFHCTGNLLIMFCRVCGLDYRAGRCSAKRYTRASLSSHGSTGSKGSRGEGTSRISRNRDGRGTLSIDTRQRERRTRSTDRMVILVTFDSNLYPMSMI